MPKKSKEPSIRQWLTVCYEPVSFFSLKRSDATSMAARTNLVPTPYSIKMALLKVLIEAEGYQHSDGFDDWISREFTWIRDLEIRLLPSVKMAVNRNGYKLRYFDQTADKADKSRPTLPLQGGFVFREWVHLSGALTICCGVSEKIEKLQSLLMLINYFGKRGSFFQYLPDCTQITDDPTIKVDPSNSFILQPMDDVGAQATFSRINPHSDEKIRPGKDRIVQSGLLPLKLIATSAKYDLYARQ